MCVIHMCYSSSGFAPTHIRSIKSIFHMAGMNAGRGQLRILCVNDFVTLCAALAHIPVGVEDGGVLEA